jgi:hypothetical protein
MARPRKPRRAWQDSSNTNVPLESPVYHVILTEDQGLSTRVFVRVSSPDGRQHAHPVQAAGEGQQ